MTTCERAGSETADVARDLGRFDDAAAAYAEELRLVAGFPINALLATVDLVEALVRGGHRREAVVAARNVMRYAAGAAGNPLAEAALLKHYHGACEGILRASAIRRLREQIAPLLSPAARPDTLGDRLRRCRRLRGITRVQAARECGVDAEILRKIESGAIPGRIHRPRLSSWLNAHRPEMALAERLPAGASPRRKERPTRP